MRRTRWPISASAAPRFTAVVVLPTPPFCIATAIVRAKIVPSLTHGGENRERRGESPGSASTIGRGVRDPYERAGGTVALWRPASGAYRRRRSTRLPQE